jgi:hypothetical protein
MRHITTHLSIVAIMPWVPKPASASIVGFAGWCLRSTKTKRTSGRRSASSISRCILRLGAPRVTGLIYLCIGFSQMDSLPRKISNSRLTRRLCKTSSTNPSSAFCFLHHQQTLSPFLDSTIQVPKTNFYSLQLNTRDFLPLLFLLSTDIIYWALPTVFNVRSSISYYLPTFSKGPQFLKTHYYAPSAGCSASFTSYEDWCCHEVITRRQTQDI